VKLFDRDNVSERIGVIAQRYSVSWYNTIDHVPEERCVDGSSVPVAEGDEVLACLQENIDEAIFNRDGIRDRYERAERDGLFDLKRAKDVDEEALKAWLAAVDIMKGDKGRCIAELRHWREYLELARSGQLPRCKHVSVRELADRKSA